MCRKNYSQASFPRIIHQIVVKPEFVELVVPVLDARKCNVSMQIIIPRVLPLVRVVAKGAKLTRMPSQQPGCSTFL